MFVDTNEQKILKTSLVLQLTCSGALDSAIFDLDLDNVLWKNP